MANSNSRQNGHPSGLRESKAFSPRREGGRGKGRIPFAGWVASFWPLAIIPGLFVTLCLRHEAAAEQGGGGTGPVLAGIATAYLFNSLFTIWFYKEDKSQAERQLRRIPEFHLHFWEAFCGWPGALYAQRKYHHKWKKRSYMIVFCLYVVANVLAVGYLVCPDSMKSASAEALDWMFRLLNVRK